jgi:hypothetical protein
MMLSMRPELESTLIVRRVTMVFAITAAVIAVSPQSLWIDEVVSAWPAAEPSFVRFLQSMGANGNSESQMPLFMSALWAWEKAVGHGEWALRALNLLWFVPGLYLFANGRTERLLVASASAFVWYCLDEARPYGMQLGLSLLIFGLLERAIRAGSRGDAAAPLLRPYETWLLALGFIALAGSSLLGAIWAAAVIAGTGLAVTWRRPQLTRVWRPGVVLVLALIVLAAYYAWTLTRGARGTAVGGTGLPNVIFSGYELLGLAGLGPGRTDLRTNGLASFTPYLVPLALAAVCTGAVLVAGAIHIWRAVERRMLVSYSAMLGGGAVLILAVGYVVHWRVVGRHLTPLLPLMLAVQAVGLVALWRRPVSRVVVVAFLVLAFTSAATIRFAPRHAKDDYRAAAAVAQAALRSGEKVWWNADPLGALIYDVPLADGCEGATFLDNPLHGFAKSILAPTVVISSKPDIYDGHGALAQYLERNNYRRTASFMSFDVWKKPSSTPITDCFPNKHERR